MFIHLWTQDVYDFQKISEMYSNLPTLFFHMFPFDPPKNFNKMFSGGGQKEILRRKGLTYVLWSDGHASYRSPLHFF